MVHGTILLLLRETDNLIKGFLKIVVAENGYFMVLVRTMEMNVLFKTKYLYSFIKKEKEEDGNTLEWNRFRGLRYFVVLGKPGWICRVVVLSGCDWLIVSWDCTDTCWIIIMRSEK